MRTAYQVMLESRQSSLERKTGSGVSDQGARGEEFAQSATGASPTAGIAIVDALHRRTALARKVGAAHGYVSCGVTLAHTAHEVKHRNQSVTLFYP